VGAGVTRRRSGLVLARSRRPIARPARAPPTSPNVAASLPRLSNRKVLRPRPLKRRDGLTVLVELSSSEGNAGKRAATEAAVVVMLRFASARREKTQRIEALQASKRKARRARVAVDTGGARLCGLHIRASLSDCEKKGKAA
jgi:hypothetical protein